MVLKIRKYKNLHEFLSTSDTAAINKCLHLELVDRSEGSCVASLIKVTKTLWKEVETQYFTNQTNCPTVC